MSDANERKRISLQEAVSMCDDIVRDAEKRRAESDRDDVDSVLQELADHKQRLAAQSARLAAAESELRRLRRVIDGAQVTAIIFNDLQQVHDVDVFDEDDDGVPCKVIRMSELEASDAD